MKKFTKGCLITALILFLFGCVMFGVFGLLGGFGQLGQIEGEWIPFFQVGDSRFGFDDNGGFQYVHLSDEKEWEKEHEGWQRADSAEVSSGQRINVGSLRNLDLEMAGCALTIQESEDENVWLSMHGDTKKIYYQVSGDTLEIEGVKQYRYPVFGGRSIQNIKESAEVVLYLPKERNLGSVEIEVGAGKIAACPLAAEDIEIKVGAGECVLDGIRAHDVTLSVGAGKATIKEMTAYEADIEVGAGEMVVSGMDISGEIELDVGMGSAELEGTITGNLDADCGMGNLRIQLNGTEEEHNYTIDSAMGSTTIGRNDYSGLANKKYIDNHSSSHFDIDCAMGNVTILFDR